MSQESEKYPNHFAKVIGGKVGLIKPITESYTAKDVELLETLGAFQEASLFSSYERSLMISYFEHPLSEEQRDALKLIHDYTNDFYLMDIAKSIRTKLASPRTSARDFANMLEVLLEQVLENRACGGSHGPTDKAKSLRIHFAGEKTPNPGEKDIN